MVTRFRGDSCYGYKVDILCEVMTIIMTSDLLIKQDCKQIIHFLFVFKYIQELIINLFSRLSIFSFSKLVPEF